MSNRYTGNLRLKEKANVPDNRVFNQAGQVIGTIVTEAEQADPGITPAVNEVKTAISKVSEYATDNALGVNTRTLEKLLVYGAGIVGATNGFAQLSMQPSIRAALIGAAGFVTALMAHNSKNS